MAAPNFDQAAEEQSLLDSVASSFNDSASFPDLTVTLNGHTVWLCHKFILCKRSKYFSTLISGSFKENGASLIEVHEGDPQALEAALEYCYKLGNISLNERAHDAEMSAAVFHVRLFQVAEYYAIKGLEGLAADGFVEAIKSEEITAQQLAEAFQEAYETTTDSDKLLRKAISEKTLSNVKYYLGEKCPYFSSLIAAVPEFAIQIAKAMANSFVKKRSVPNQVAAVQTLYCCPDCGIWGGYVAPKFEPGRVDLYSYICIACNQSFSKTIKEWQSNHMKQKLAMSK